MKITILDAKTLGDDLDLSVFNDIGETTIYPLSDLSEIADRVEETEVIVVNKLKLNETNLYKAKNLKLICIAATGYDNIDTEYCKSRGIQVSNVKGYSTESVAQTTIATILELTTHIKYFSNYVASGEYTKSGVANKLTPIYHEIAGKTWGVVGLGNIGRKVANIAKAFGCNVIANKRSSDDEYEIVDLNTLFEKSDIISIHTPLNSETKGLISKELISKMKKDAILYNAARGLVTDEYAIMEAIKENRIGAFGCDVYSKEPFDENHPMYMIKNFDNVCLTPHMAWGSHEARERCIFEMIKNIEAYEKGERRNSVNL